MKHALSRNVILVSARFRRLIQPVPIRLRPRMFHIEEKLSRPEIIVLLD